jgi:hypothetical protein
MGPRGPHKYLPEYSPDEELLDSEICQIARLGGSRACGNFVPLIVHHWHKLCVNRRLHMRTMIL